MLMLPSEQSIPAADAATCAVLVLSCDKYRDLWPAVTTLFNRYWPDCPWPKYLASDLPPPVYAGFAPLGAGATALDWSSVLQRVLAQLPAEHVLLFLDDFFLTARVDTAHASRLLHEMSRLHAAYLRLVPHRHLLRRWSDSDLAGEHVRGLPYRTSLQAAFWQRSILQELLRAGESPWEFETHASARSEARSEPFLAAWRTPAPYVDVLERGKWLPRGLRLCRKEGLSVDLGARPMISYADRIRRFESQAVAGMVGLIPQRLRTAFRTWRLRAGRS